MIRHMRIKNAFAWSNRIESN